MEEEAQLILKLEQGDISVGEHLKEVETVKDVTLKIIRILY